MRDGEILFDAAQAAHDGTFAEAWLAPEFWHARGETSSGAGGRGGVTFVRSDGKEWVLRHYRRGGLAARVLGDSYLWTGADRTRCFREVRLLAQLSARGFDVPRPVAAAYRRHGFGYRADLIMQKITQVDTLAEIATRKMLSAATAQRVGAAIARVHGVGVYHADLNAHNILIDAQRVWLIDFDRGEIRQPQRAWQQANLARLKRSLRKIGAGGFADEQFDSEFWRPLLTSYEQVLADSSDKDAH